MLDVHPSDFAVRHEVVQPNGSFIVSAPAGSGKTALLTHRVLKLLSVVDKPEEILAITFTRKAAAEMHERIFGYLERANQIRQEAYAREQCSEYELELIDCASAALARSKALQWGLLDNPDRLTISTIDGFCKSICNSLPIFSGIGAQTSVLDDPHSEYDLIVRRWLIDSLNDIEKNTTKNTPENDQENLTEHRDKAPLASLLSHFSGNTERLIDLLSSLLGKRDQWLSMVNFGYIENAENSAELRRYFEVTLTDWLYQEIDTIAEYFQVYEGELFELIRFAYSNRNQARDSERLARLVSFDSFPRREPGTIQFWSDLAHFCLTGKQKYRISLTAKDGFPTYKNKDENEFGKQRKHALLRIFSELQELGLEADTFSTLLYLPTEVYKDESWTILGNLLPVLVELTAYLKVRFSELRQADFIEFSLGAVLALGSEYGDVDLQQRLDYRVRHILIDEFQDTSHTQLDLLRALTKEWLPDDGRTLFLVGDGMQSCYGFRNANVGIFLGMQEQGLPNVTLKPRKLEVNFRSSSTIVDWVNSAFSHAFPKRDDRDTGQVAYIDSIAAKTELKPEPKYSYVRCLAFEPSEDEEAQWIAKEIKYLQQAYPEQSIAVLARNRSVVQTLIWVLASLEIDYSAVDFDPLLSKQHIIDLHCVARWLHDDTDKIAFLSLLRSPIAACDHDSLRRILNPRCSDTVDTTIEDHSEHPKHCSTLAQLTYALHHIDFDPKVRSRIERMHGILSSARANIYRRSFSELVELTWIGMGGVESMQNHVAFEDVQRYLQILRGHEKSNIIEEWEKFETRLYSEYAYPLAKTDNPVQIMTIHKSKGLEFDTVFLPSLHKHRQKTDSDILHWMEKLESDMRSRFILSPISAKHEDKKDQVTEYIIRNQKRKAYFEDTRIFYVACTRAKQRLYLTSECALDENNAPVPPVGSTSYISRIWPVVEDDIQVQRAGKEVQQNPPSTQSESLNRIRALPNSWQSAIGNGDGSTSIFDNSDFNFLEAWNNQNTSEKSKGIVVHSLLQLMASQRHSASDEGSNEVFRRFIAVKLKQQGFNGKALTKTYEDLIQLCELLQSSPDFQWLTKHTHCSVHSEWNVWSTEKDNESALIGRKNVIDRAFIDGHIRWIIDYKTAMPSPNQSLDDFVEEQWQIHEKQMLRYRTVVLEYDRRYSQAHEVSETRLALFFPFIPALSHKAEFDL